MNTLRHRNTVRPTLTAGLTSLRAAAYRRVSSEEQVDGYSLDAQSRAVRHYCDAHGWQIVQEYGDEGKSVTDALSVSDFSNNPIWRHLHIMKDYFTLTV